MSRCTAASSATPALSPWPRPSSSQADVGGSSALPPWRDLQSPYILTLTVLHALSGWSSRPSDWPRPWNAITPSSTSGPTVARARSKSTACRSPGSSSR
eukprot:7389219-Pyramimonas_sp.AAC.1